MCNRFFYTILSLLCGILFTSTSSFAQKIYSNSPSFIENKGQILNQNNQQNTEVLFLYSGKGLKIQLRKSGYSYELFSVKDAPENTAIKFKDPQELLKTTITTNRVDVDFVGMNANPEVVAEQKSESRLNYFISGSKIMDVNSFHKVTYKNVYPKIDIEFVLNENAEIPFKYNIILNVGADIDKIKFLIKGATLVKSDNGDIAIASEGGTINETIPDSYYLNQPNKKEKVNFVVKNHTVSFSSNYDKTQQFVIDPSTNRIWGTYYGSTSLDYCTATDIDTQNNVYISGYTLSTTNIATSGVYQSTSAGSFDIYLAKFNSNGSRIWATYFGGSSVEAAYGMCTASNGNIYLCGDTFSTSGVATAGAHQTIYGGGIDDALLVKFDSTGQLVWATYYGGLLHDISTGVVEDSSGNVIISGHSESAAAIATVGSYNNTYMGGYDVFVAKFNSMGVRQWGTYYGEIDVDESFAIDCDASNNIYITGFTTSTNDIATPSGHQTSYSGLQDAFIAKFNPTGTTLLYGTYYGGPGNDQGTSIKVDVSGEIYLTGNTTSLIGIASSGAYQSSIGSADDGFIARFNAAGVRQWGTYFGGNDVDYIAGLTMDSNNNLFFCGSTLSTNAISTSAAYQPAIGSINMYDSYFQRFSKNGMRELGTYFGGSSNDHGRGIAMDAFGKIYIAGETSSTNNIASVGAFNTTWAGSDDAFLAKFCVAPEPIIYPSGTSTICYGDTLWLSTQTGFSTYLWNYGSTSNLMATDDSAAIGTYYYSVEVSDGTGCNSTSDSSIVIVDVCLGLHDNSNTISLQLYPIPATEVIFFDINESFKKELFVVEIYSTLGELIYITTCTQSQNYIDIKKLSPGMYILQVRANEKVVQKKFIKQ